MAKLINFDEEARRGLERGVNKLADAVKVGESDLDTLVTRKVDAIDTGQRESPLSYLALTLLVARVLADYVYLAMATNDLALVAHLLDRRTYLHVSSFQ